MNESTISDLHSVALSTLPVPTERPVHKMPVRKTFAILALLFIGGIILARPAHASVSPYYQSASIVSDTSRTVKGWKVRTVRFSDGGTTVSKSRQSCKGNSCTLSASTTARIVYRGKVYVTALNSRCTWLRSDPQNTNYCTHS